MIAQVGSSTYALESSPANHTRCPTAEETTRWLGPSPVRHLEQSVTRRWELGAGPAAAQRHPWRRGSVHFLDHPLEPTLGGTAATAYLLGRLGERVSLNTQVGDDALGAVLKSWFSEAGVALVVPAAASAAANVLLVAPDGTPRWHHYTGKNVDWQRSLAVTDAAWFYASGYGQATGIDLTELCEVFQVFRSRGTKIAFDPGPWLFIHASREQMLQSWAQVVVKRGAGGGVR